MKIKLDLSESDLKNLIEVLSTCLSDLNFKITDTGSQDFRDKLKLKRNSLNRLLKQLAIHVPS